MNGSIGVKSTPGQGSTFFITLPVCPTQTGIVNTEKVSHKINETTTVEETDLFKVLYIEDNPANLKLVEDIFTDYPEIKLLAATHAKMGIDMAIALKPDLILMDINLPGIDGIEALRRLRNFEETHDTPVIAVSANAMKRDIDTAMSAGFKSYITKPININNFRKVIESELNSKINF